MSRVAIAALALLVLGAAGGVAADRMLHRSHSPNSRLLDEVEQDPIGVMERELKLTPEQRDRVRAIMERRQDAINAVWRDTHIRLRATIDSVVSEIAAELNPEQASRFRVLADEIHSSGRRPHLKH